MTPDPSKTHRITRVLTLFRPSDCHRSRAKLARFGDHHRSMCAELHIGDMNPVHVRHGSGNI
jgi:hypothetical protein